MSSPPRTSVSLHLFADADGRWRCRYSWTCPRTGKQEQRVTAPTRYAETAAAWAASLWKHAVSHRDEVLHAWTAPPHF